MCNGMLSDWLWWYWKGRKRKRSYRPQWGRRGQGLAGVTGGVGTRSDRMTVCPLGVLWLKTVEKVSSDNVNKCWHFSDNKRSGIGLWTQWQQGEFLWHSCGLSRMVWRWIAEVELLCLQSKQAKKDKGDAEVFRLWPETLTAEFQTEANLLFSWVCFCCLQ